MPDGVGVSGRSSPAAAALAFVAELDPGSFAWVMASGIVSVGADLLGHITTSRVALGVTILGFVVLVPAYTLRIVLFPQRFRASLRDPATAMAYFTVVAGLDVLAFRLIEAGDVGVSLGLGTCAAVLWVVLTYGLPALLIGAARRPVLGEFNGTWLVWVVATQSLAIVAAGLSTRSSWAGLRDALPAVAVAFWGVGVMLYLILIVIICMRLLLVEMTPAEMGPAYWIAMGATAISVRAAAGILEIGSVRDRLVTEIHPVLVGLSLVFWAFGTWWIPMLVLFGVWRHVLRRYPLQYEPRLWSVVFPLGMYTVACRSLGTATDVVFLRDLASFWLWVGLAAWVIVQAAMVVKEGRTLAAWLVGDRRASGLT